MPDQLNNRFGGGIGAHRKGIADLWLVSLVEKVGVNVLENLNEPLDEQIPANGFFEGVFPCPEAYDENATSTPVRSLARCLRAAPAERLPRTDAHGRPRG